MTAPHEMSASEATTPPCLAPPFGSCGNDLPIGLRLVGARFSDRRLLAIGQVLSERLGLECPAQMGYAL
jgi:Asp-tRNA(Asn)/Glu-tRNA(Gln) amidotransferase A subunit family amidase